MSLASQTTVDYFGRLASFAFNDVWLPWLVVPPAFIIALVF